MIGTSCLFILLLFICPLAVSASGEDDVEKYLERCSRTLGRLRRLNSGLIGKDGRVLPGLAPWHQGEKTVPAGMTLCANPLDFVNAKGETISVGEVIEISGVETAMVISTYRDGAGEVRAIVLRVSSLGAEYDLLSPFEQEAAAKKPDRRTQFMRQLSRQQIDWRTLAFNSPRLLPVITQVQVSQTNDRKKTPRFKPGTWITYQAEVDGHAVEKMGQITHLSGSLAHFPDKMMMSVAELDSEGEKVYRALSISEIQGAKPFVMPEASIPADYILRITGLSQFLAAGGEVVGPESHLSWEDPNDDVRRENGELLPFEFLPEHLGGFRNGDEPIFPVQLDSGDVIDLADGYFGSARAYDGKDDNSRVSRFLLEQNRREMNREMPVGWDREVFQRVDDPLGGRRYVSRLTRMAPAKPDGWESIQPEHWLKRFPTYMKKLGYELTPENALSYPDAEGFNRRLEALAPSPASGLISRADRFLHPMEKSPLRFEFLGTERSDTSVMEQIKLFLLYFSEGKMIFPASGAPHFGFVSAIPAMALIPAPVYRAMMGVARILKQVMDEVPEMRPHVIEPVLGLRNVVYAWNLFLPQAVHFELEAHALSLLNQVELYVVSRPEGAGELLDSVREEFGLPLENAEDFHFVLDSRAAADLMVAIAGRRPEISQAAREKVQKIAESTSPDFPGRFLPTHWRQMRSVFSEPNG